MSDGGSPIPPPPHEVTTPHLGHHPPPRLPPPAPGQTWSQPPPPPPESREQGNTVNVRAVRILLEWILVYESIHRTLYWFLAPTGDVSKIEAGEVLMVFQTKRNTSVRNLDQNYYRPQTKFALGGGGGGRGYPACNGTAEGVVCIPACNGDVSVYPSMQLGGGWSVRCASYWNASLFIKLILIPVIFLWVGGWRTHSHQNSIH